MTYQQAADVVEQLIRENAAYLTPAPRLEADGPVLGAPCSGPNDDQKTGTVMVEHSYWLRDIDSGLNDSMFVQIRRYWAKNGYRVGLDTGTSGDREVVATNPRNGFRVYLTEGQHVLSLGAQSTCVPEPPMPTNQPLLPRRSES